MNWLPRHKVLVPVDFSPASLDAVDVGLASVDEPSHLCVIHVAAKVIAGEPGFPWNATGEETQRAQIVASMHELLAPVIESGIQVQVAFGDPGSEIAEFAQEGEFELIVMPSHGRAGLTRLLIGSVAERVTRLAHCPVLILRN